MGMVGALALAEMGRTRVLAGDVVWEPCTEHAPAVTSINIIERGIAGFCQGEWDEVAEGGGGGAEEVGGGGWGPEGGREDWVGLVIWWGRARVRQFCVWECLHPCAV